MVVEIGDTAVGHVSQSSESGSDPADAAVLRLSGVRVAGLGLPTDDVTGELVVTRHRLCWAGAQRGAAIPVADIGLHAVARDAAAEHGPCVYLQVGDADDELRIFPQSPALELDRIWEALCVVSGFVDDGDDVKDEGTSNHRDDEIHDDDDDAYDAYYADAEDDGNAAALHGVGLGGYSVFDRLNRMFADEKTATAAQDRDGTSGVADSLEACHIDVSQRSPDNPH
jgi:Regulator of volume decrease after cellular swelling